MVLAMAHGSAGLFEHHLRALHAGAAVRGDAGQVLQQLEIGDALADADELITVHSTATHEARLRSVTLLAECMR